MSLLDPRLWLAVILGLALAYCGGRWQQSRSDAARYQTERTATALDAARAQIKAVDAVRLEEQRRTAAQTEIANVAKQDADTARADARAAGDAADRLRKRVEQLLAAAGSATDTGLAGPSKGQPGGDPLDVLVDVLGRSDRATGIVADYADRLKVAGLACERIYDALSPSK
ncbi:DUF2514 family protein [Cupriavidus pauculus]|uniref:DUF2514 family protein n=1 Tax=Cupriavidus pauculus TaxID=82633 RepID=UPI00078476BF|nr:DUF2514 family protein [Cupriavidus pauculus]